tara:strand:+ start:5097 stop:7502 length:2406 start_codon:yes stop_codon:yes gene_type:complete
MKNKILSILILLLFSKIALAENLNIQAKKISIDKKDETTIFENEVKIIDDKSNVITSDYAKYNKKLNFFTLKNNIIVEDNKGNIFKSNNATYDKNNDLFKAIGKSSIISSEGYIVETENVIWNLNDNIANSKNHTKITDLDNNIINLDNFEYLSKENIFKSIGNIEVNDNIGNKYKFSQIYLDEKKREIIGTDAKAFLNQSEFKFDDRNKPRVFSNAINIKEGQTKFIKSTFTLCDYRENNKCPPWELRAKEMRHDSKKKTVYYENAVIKIYNFPIFYLPRLAHPDPTVNRRSGFLAPLFADTKNLGSSVNLPYFWAIGDDKDLTINNRLFASEHPLFIGEYRQAFASSDLILDFGYTEGYKNTSSTKRSGDKSHFFSRYVKRFDNDDGNKSNLEINIENVSNKKYLKLYRIESNLVDYETNTLENYFDFNHFNDENDFLFSFKGSVFETLKGDFNDKYEYILPDINLNKNFFSEKFGSGEISSNIKFRNYDTNKSEKFIINNLSWNFDDPYFDKIYDGKFLASIKNFNYETKNIDKFKDKTTSEFFGAVGYLASLDLYKKVENNNSHFLTPKILMRYSPNHMRKQTGDFILHDKDIFSLDRLGVSSNFESGTNLTAGLNYQHINNGSNLNFSLGQIINEKKNNKNMPSSSSLNDRFSDIVGNINFNNNKNFKINYDYSLDQNLKETNYNKLSADLEMDKINFNLDYLEENNVSEVKEYITSGIEYKQDNGLFKLSNKRNLITNSSEYYKLSYEYINDCLRAGLIYRREFYDDSELEPENSLMFTITLSPFGSINTPGLSQ